MKGIIFLEDGSVFEGKGFGFKGTSVGEIVFNTSMAGYQEIITDPASKDQIITMTYPLIGNYGVNLEFSESKKVYAKGLIVKTICTAPSNFMGVDKLNEMLIENMVIAVGDVDTRSITGIIRENGTQKCVISTEDISKEDANKLMSSFSKDEFSMKSVGCEKEYTLDGEGAHIVAIDLGTKGSVLKTFNEKGCKVTVMPYSTSFDEIINKNASGVLLTDGPGNPKNATEIIEITKNLIDNNIPVFGVSLGHEIIALSQGATIYKLKYGHRGSNHGVHDLINEKCFITSQSHAYAVDKESILNTPLNVTHINLNDGTVEGIEHKDKDVISVQFIPEGAPGPSDTDYLIDNFLKFMKVEV